MNLTIALRNVFRNRRRSAMTMATVGFGAAAILLLGALMAYIVLEFQTVTVRRVGHLAVYRHGYFQFGAGAPASYGIADPGALLALIAADAELAKLVAVATPTQVISGVAGNYDAGISKTFFGQGIVPADRARMREWNDYGIDVRGADWRALSRPDGAIIGYGVGRILGLCAVLKIPDCATPPAAPQAATAASTGADDALPALLAATAAAAPPRAATNQLDLLAATASGAPNVVSVHAERAEFFGGKELDDNLVVVQLPLAQRLVYGRAAPGVTAITVQLHHTADLGAARAALARLFAARHLDLEVRDFTELTPLYTQTLRFFGFLFGFIAIVIGAIVLFTIMNTMSMSVMERVGEIGTARALGVHRSQLRLQFVSEGWFLGMLGASTGLLLAVVAVAVINHSGLTWSPPTTAGTEPLKLLLFGNPGFVASTWLVLVAVAALAALLPANKAARMDVVDALRHV